MNDFLGQALAARQAGRSDTSVEILTLDEARRIGATRYFTGEPCPRGHISERSVYLGRCLACGRESARASLSAKEYRKKNSKKIVAKNALWVKKNPDKVAAYQKKYHASEKFKQVAWNARQRRRAKKRARDGSCTTEELRKIKRFAKKCYICGLRFTRKDPPNVDHVLPLDSELSTNSQSNMALVHRRCNSAKSARRFNPITGQGILV